MGIVVALDVHRNQMIVRGFQWTAQGAWSTMSWSILRHSWEAAGALLVWSARARAISASIFSLQNSAKLCWPGVPGWKDAQLRTGGMNPPAAG
jgi:hypothetical protein